MESFKAPQLKDDYIRTGRVNFCSYVLELVLLISTRPVTMYPFQWTHLPDIVSLSIKIEGGRKMEDWIPCHNYNGFTLPIGCHSTLSFSTHTNQCISADCEEKMSVGEERRWSVPHSVECKHLYHQLICDKAGHLSTVLPTTSLGYWTEILELQCKEELSKTGYNIALHCLVTPAFRVRKKPTLHLKLGNKVLLHVHEGISLWAWGLEIKKQCYSYWTSPGPSCSKHDCH